MHIQAGQCGNQIGAKVRPRAAPTRRSRRPARLPRPHPSRPPGREAGRRRALEPRSPPRSREQSPGPALPLPPPPFSCPCGSRGPARARGESAATLLPRLRPPPLAAAVPPGRGPLWGRSSALSEMGGVGRFGWGCPLKAIMIPSVTPPGTGGAPCPQPRFLASSCAFVAGRVEPVLSRPWFRAALPLGAAPPGQPPAGRVRHGNKAGLWAWKAHHRGPSPPSSARLADVRTEAGRGGGMYPRSGVTSPSAGRLALAQGHTSPCGHARGAQAGWVRRCGPRFVGAVRGKRAALSGPRSGTQRGVVFSWSLNPARRQGLEGKGPNKASSGGCCRGNQRRTKS